MSLFNILKGKSFLDLFWSFSDNLIQQIINFIVGIILARLLLPEEFGLLGIVTVFITLSHVFVDGGFSAALINKKDATEEDFNTVFYSNIIISIIIYLIIYISADLIAVFFNNPMVATLLRLSGLNILLIALTAVHRTIVIKNLNFKIITIVSFVAVSISATCAIWMSYAGFGVYSLVFRILIGQLITVILFWIINKWKPKLIFSKESFKELFGYGINLFVSNFLNKIHSNIYYLIIGKYFSPINLGYYTRANSFKDLASNNISNTINRVSFSTLSKISDRVQQFYKFLFFQNINYLLTAFSMLFLFFCAEEIILILLTDKWSEAINILRILSLSGVFVSLYSLNLDYLAVLKHTGLYLKIEVLGKILVIPIVIAGIVWNFDFFLYLIVLHSILMYGVSLYVVDNKNKGVAKKQIILIVKFILMVIILFSINYIFKINTPHILLDVSIKILIVIILFIMLNISYLKSFFNKNK